MRQGFRRALLVLAFLASLSRLSFADTLFVVTGSVEDRVAGGADATINLPTGVFGSGGPNDWEEGPWAIGSVESAIIGVQGQSGLSLGTWSFDGFTGSYSELYIDADAGPFTVDVEDDEITGIPVKWAGEIELYSDPDSGTLLFEIQMEGIGTASILGSESAGVFEPGAGIADLIGVGQVVYENPSIPEPNTLTLMGTGLITFVVVAGFRRRYSNALLGRHPY